MRSVLVDGRAALRERIASPQQVQPTDASAELPPYIESFLAHLRLLVGVPFEYLVPDARLLPTESIRFFYLDRSWVDRLVDGALAVGKIGSREQAHHQAHHTGIQQRLDLTQREVRPLQRGRKDFARARLDSTTAPGPEPDGRITGFLLRSAAVSGWPRIDVRAYDTRLPEPIVPVAADAHRLRTLRQERLSPSVLLVLFEGTPQLVVLEEPHQGVVLGVQRSQSGYAVVRRTTAGTPDSQGRTVDVPVRAKHPRVLAIGELRRRLHVLSMTDASVSSPRGSADLAVQLLSAPCRQRFEGEGGPATGTGPLVTVSAGLRDATLADALARVVR